MSLVLAQNVYAVEAHGIHHNHTLPAGRCQKIVFEGTATAGKPFVKQFGKGLEFVLDPIESGWVIRVEPEAVQKLSLDHAELATPPFNSVNPLLVTTDYSFRAQDVVGWNPRHFQFLTSRAAARNAEAAYRAYMKAPEQTGNAAVQSAMQLLATLPEKSAQGDFRILDAHLVPGTANQAQTAKFVVSHFTSTPHTLDQPANGRATPLGRVNWLRFRVTLLLPADFVPATALKGNRSQCKR